MDIYQKNDNKNFENEVLKSIFGKDIFDKLGQAYIESLRNGKKNFSQKYVVFKNEINHFKESLDVDNYSEETLNIDCSILFNINKGIKIKEAIDNYNNNCRNGWKINVDGMDEDDRAIPFPYKIIYDLTKDITKEISKILIDIIHNVSDTKTIFYVGGFCNSKMVVDSIRENIDKEYPNLNHIRPNDPGNAVLKGAVMYGISPDRIKIRKAKYSLGMSAYLDWKSDYENGGIKYYDDEFKKYVCKNAFYNFISKEEDIPYDNIIKKPLRLRKYDDGTYGGELIIYKSTKINTLFIDEDDVEEIGRFNLLIDDGNEYSDGDEIFYVSMELGGTFLNAKAFHEKSNTCEEIKFKY